MEERLALPHEATRSTTEAALMRRFLHAWEAVDVDGIVTLLAGDAVLTMPPERMRVAGPAAIGGFFSTVPMDGRLELIHLVETRANGQPALAAYVEAGDGTLDAYGVMVFAVEGERIAGITGFAGQADLFTEFGLELKRPAS